MSVALVVFQLKVDAWPALMVLGFAVRVAVGAGCGGGGGGGAVATFFFPQALTISTAANARTRPNHFNLLCCTVSSSYLFPQFGCVFSPLAVNCLFCVPSASIVYSWERPVRFD